MDILTIITLTNNFLTLASLIFSIAILIFSALIRASCSSLEILLPFSLMQELVEEAIGFDVDEGDAEEDTPLDDEGVFSALLIVLIVIGDTTSSLISFDPPITWFNCLLT